MSEWKPIESAPKDGTHVLAGYQRPGSWRSPVYPLTSFFVFGQWCAHFGNGHWKAYDPQPNVWMPLPNPPAPEVK